MVQNFKVNRMQWAMGPCDFGTYISRLYQGYLFTLSDNFSYKVIFWKVITMVSTWFQRVTVIGSWTSNWWLMLDNCHCSPIIGIEKAILESTLHFSNILCKYPSKCNLLIIYASFFFHHFRYVLNCSQVDRV